jgi:hypothetical protein
MKIFLILVLTLSHSLALAQSAEEEAIILNQELQFLEDSVKNVETVSLRADRESQFKRALNEPTLEKRYFGEDVQEDVISTRTSGLKRGASKQ